MLARKLGTSIVRPPFSDGELAEKRHGGPLRRLIHVQLGLNAGLDSVDEILDYVEVAAAVTCVVSLAALISVGKKIVEIAERTPCGISGGVILSHNSDLCNVAETAGRLVAALGSLNLIIAMLCGRGEIVSTRILTSLPLASWHITWFTSSLRSP